MTNGTGEKKEKKTQNKKTRNLFVSFTIKWKMLHCQLQSASCQRKGHLWSRVRPSELRVRWACELYTPLPCSTGPLVSPCATASRVSVRACVFIVLPDLAQVRAELPACASVLQNLAGGKTAIFFPPLR